MSRDPITHLRAIDTAETLTHKEGIVDLWYCFYQDTHEELLDAHEVLLSPLERDQHRRFRFGRDRRLYLATRVLVRTVLSRYSAVSPGDWRFANGEHGKPRIAAPLVTPLIHFNLANTPGLVVCAVSVAHESLGVDVERIDREIEAVALSERYFSASEATRIRALPTSEQQTQFFAHWTLKESYIKARGVGLGLPLDQVSFLCQDGISVDFDPRLSEDSSLWRFSLLDAPPHHMIAVSVRTDGRALSLRASQVVPLAENPTWPP
jgi:4'-phosphopantetheinyl transferase